MVALTRETGRQASNTARVCTLPVREQRSTVSGRKASAFGGSGAEKVAQAARNEIELFNSLSL
jgi:hypothetical protein